MSHERSLQEVHVEPDEDSSDRIMEFFDAEISEALSIVDLQYL